MSECPYGASKCPKLIAAEREVEHLYESLKDQRQVLRAQDRKLNVIIAIMLAIHGIEILTAIGVVI